LGTLVSLIVGLLCIGFGLGAALALIKSRQVSGVVVAYFDVPYDEAAEEVDWSQFEQTYHEWLDLNASPAQKSMLDLMSWDEIGRIHIVESSVSQEPRRLLVIGGYSGPMFEPGRRVTLLLNSKEQEKAEFGTSLGRLVGALIMLPLGVLMLLAFVQSILQMLETYL
jgi:hypothetical protein